MAFTLSYEVSPTTNPTDGHVTLSAHLQSETEGAYFTHVAIYWRVDDGSLQQDVWNGSSQDVSLSEGVALLGGGHRLWWYVYYEYGGTESGGSSIGPWDLQCPVDTTPPSAWGPSPADGSTVYPASSKLINFGLYTRDDWYVDRIEWYVDGELEGTDYRTETYTLTFHATRDVSLSKGSHSWYAKVYDESGNVSTTSTYSFTVGNVAPTAPGTPSIEGGLTTVYKDQTYTVSWTAADDYNPEDTTLTYKLEERYGDGEWTTVADGISDLSYDWTPSTLGSAELRVSATDGTEYGDVATLTGITVETPPAPNPPNDPTLTYPTGGETWREAETVTVTWTPASPEHPDGLTCAYEAEYSRSGDFSGDEVTLFSGAPSTGSYEVTLPITLVDTDTTTGKVRLRARDSYGRTSNWSVSGALTVEEESAPTVSLVTPTDGGTVEGFTPTLIFTCDDAEDDSIHLLLEISEFADFRTIIWSSNSETDYADWEEAADPYESWTTVPSGGITAGNRARVTVGTTLRYDDYYGRVRASDGLLEGDWVYFTFMVVPESGAPLGVTIGSDTYYVTACVIEENTGGEPSPITLSIPLDDWLDTSLEKGDLVAISSGLGGYTRTWNATLERWRIGDTSVELYCLQDDAYLARKLVTGSVSTADLGSVLKSVIDTYGSPLSSNHIDTSVGVNFSVTAEYKTVGEVFADGLQLAPSYFYWVDSTGDVHFVDQDTLDPPLYELYEESPT